MLRRVVNETWRIGFERSALMGSRRALAKAAKKKRKAADTGSEKAKDRFPGMPTGWDALNIYKEGKPPEERPDEEYPEWLWELTKPMPTLGELMRRAESAFREGGEAEVMERLDESERKRLFSLARRQKIKRNNERLRDRQYGK